VVVSPAQARGLLAAVRALLAAERGAAAWDEICSVVEGASESEVAEAVLRLRLGRIGYGGCRIGGGRSGRRASIDRGTGWRPTDCCAGPPWSPVRAE
jgi:hypothetical protein